MNYKKFLKFLKPTKKKIFIWLGLFFGTGYIMYLFSFTFTDVPPFFGFPIPFYLFGGGTLTGVVLSEFDFSFFIIDVIFWYIISCLFE